jgi:hypothetical protein
MDTTQARLELLDVLRRLSTQGVVPEADEPEVPSLTELDSRALGSASPTIAPAFSRLGAMAFDED